MLSEGRAAATPKKDGPRKGDRLLKPLKLPYANAAWTKVQLLSLFSRIAWHYGLGEVSKGVMA